MAAAAMNEDAADPLRHRAQQLVANGVPKAVIDVLGVVEIQPMQGEALAFARQNRCSLAHPVLIGGLVAQSAGGAGNPYRTALLAASRGRRLHKSSHGTGATRDE